MKKVNTTNPLALVDEVRTDVRSDVGKKLTYKHNQTTTAKKHKRSKKEKILSNPNVKRWYDNLARGSKITAETRVRRLGKFCETHDMTPTQLVEIALKDLRTMTDLLEDHITWMEEKNYAPGYIQDTIKSVKSWLRDSEVEIKRKLRVANPDYTPTLQNERVPNGDEMSEIFNRTKLREAVSISLISKAGLRPEVLGNHDCTDGLSLKDLPDLVIHQGVVKCINSPCRIIVRRELSKARHQYFTFCTSSATKKLVAYLNDRLASGQQLHGESPIMVPDYKYNTNRGKNQNKPFLSTFQICKEIRKTFRPRFKWRPYVLRAYFRTQLIIAESQGKISHSFASFWFGHKGDMSARYSTNKGILPESLLKEMRESFLRSEELLDQEVTYKDPIIQQKEELNDTIQKATPEQLGKMLEMVQTMNIGKINQVRE